ncbi:Protein of unknown function [Lentzea xinjiangensis]|uniref:DUF2029 domain-containing protein n=1 Tax=Lentzea xinjiangensis TaxID=402600 RepID=A0A1H9VYU0_9PSEU|nr:glycosyltransferase family 87 protein [Lentzea xinjiangensis]SES26688.1 Protein of unknown function [Lentzea xinjiangensis]
MRTSVTITAVWSVGRAAVLFAMLSNPAFPRQLVAADVRLYSAWWTRFLSHGVFPAQDVAWQYPPGAALPMAVPGLVTGNFFSYLYAFALLVLIADLAVHVLLLRRCATTRGVAGGAWYWALVPPLLGTVWFTRIDVMATALAVAAVLINRRPLVSGLLLGAGAVLKVWPLLALGGLRRGRPVFFAALAATAVLVQTQLWSTVAMPGALGFLAHQRDRGLEVEAVAATPLVLYRLSGSGPELVLRYGSWELVGPFVGIALTTCRLTALTAGVFLVIWWRRSDWHPAVPYDAALTIVLVAMVTSPVLSPQYLIWATGLAAACLTRSDTTQRPAALLIAICCLLTQLHFPVLWHGIHNRDTLAAVVLALRNALLLGAAAWSITSLWTSTRRHAVQTGQPPVAQPVPAAASDASRSPS